MNICVDRIEQGVMAKYFFLKGPRSKLSHKELVNALQDNAISLCTIKNWLRRFNSDDRSCGNEERPDRPLISLGAALQRFLKTFPFTSGHVMTGCFLGIGSPSRGFDIRNLV
jgi:hypothetical protein